MTKEDRERVDELVDELGEQIAKSLPGEVKSETDFLLWLKAARNTLTTHIQDLGGDG